MTIDEYCQKFTEEVIKLANARNAEYEREQNKKLSGNQRRGNENTNKPENYIS